MVKMGAKNAHSEDDIQGDARPLAGQYHVAVKDVRAVIKGEDGKFHEIDETECEADKYIITFEVLAGTVPGQVGREIQEYFSVTEKALARLQRYALCVGLLDPGQDEQEVLLADSIGRQLVIEIEDNEYTNRDGKQVKGVRVAYMGLWSVGNRAVADVPKDAAALKLVAGHDTPKRAGGATGGDNGGGGNTAGREPAGAASSVGEDQWEDL